MHQLEEEVARPAVGDEQPVHPHVLRADGRTQVGEGWVRGVGRRVDRAGADMAEAARHADAVRTHQVLVVVVFLVGVVALGIPRLLRRLVEVGIGKQPQSHDAGRLAVIRANRHRLAARADGDTGIFRRVGERVGRAARLPLVQPQAEMLRVGTGRFVEAGFVDQPQIGPAGVAAEFLAGMRADDLQQVERAEGGSGHAVPEAVVAAGPHHPGVAPLHFRRGQRHAAIHVVEIILGGGGKRRGIAPGAQRLVADRLRGALPLQDGYDGGCRDQQQRQQTQTWHRDAPARPNHGVSLPAAKLLDSGIGVGKNNRWRATARRGIDTPPGAGPAPRRARSLM